jgi:hypothetical protein
MNSPYYHPLILHYEAPKKRLAGAFMNGPNGTDRSNDHTMIAATETAKRNPMRPPDTLPRDAASAAKLFCAQRSPRLIALFVLVLGLWRMLAGPLSWIDALAALAVFAYFPFNEWLIHVFILHYRPHALFGRTIDFYLPVTHRRHHADPWNLKWILIPLHVHVLTVPLIACLLWMLWPWHLTVLTAAATYLLLGLHYEWVHYLAHIPWCPSIGYYQRRVREHRYHHFRNENYWWGVSMGLADRVFGTAPCAEEVGRSRTTSTIGIDKR